MNKKRKVSRVSPAYFIKEGVGNVFTHGFMSFASVCIIVACLIIMGTFSLIALNINVMISKLEDENEIVAYVDDSYSRDEALALQSQIEALPNVSETEFITKEEAMDSFVEEYDSDLFEGIGSDVFRDRYVVYLDNISEMSDTQQDLLGITGIAKVTAHIEIANSFITVRNVVGIVSIIIVAVLFVISLFIMSNTIKLTTFDRQDEIAIMKMVGAKNAFIRWPFVVEGMFLGLVGAMISFALQWGIYEIVSERVSTLSIASLITIMPFGTIAIPILIVFAVIGLIVGIGGSMVAIRNYLKV